MDGGPVFGRQSHLPPGQDESGGGGVCMGEIGFGAGGCENGVDYRREARRGRGGEESEPDPGKPRLADSTKASAVHLRNVD
ncbi:unnamed protein product [Protopolystoma xenopodis]|uniref:Uncharacterized protein n=1 Tax=Protopolystoma xenopodis TaxID=117903 RepID=A0A3S5CIK7_9PLAT|nr:unnamed protein product [Protopolystoma xenopodis]